MPAQPLSQSRFTVGHYYTNTVVITSQLRAVVNTHTSTQQRHRRPARHICRATMAKYAAMRLRRYALMLYAARVASRHHNARIHGRRVLPQRAL